MLGVYARNGCLTMFTLLRHILDHLCVVVRVMSCVVSVILSQTDLVSALIPKHRVSLQITKYVHASRVVYEVV